MKGRLLSIAAALLLASSAGAEDDPARRLDDAKAAAAGAAARAAGLERAAAREANAARQAQLTEAALAARIAGTQADVAAAEARVALVARRVAAHRAGLAAAQRPIARLVAALQSLAARPALVAVVQPGSVDDLVHVRAVLGATMPVVRARTERVRAELEQARALGRSEALAATALRASRLRLERERLAQVRLEARHRLRSGTLGRSAVFESDRALALGEQARDLVGALDLAQDAARVEARAAALPGPLLRPGDGGGDGDGARAARGVYRLPAPGRLVQGLGELSDAGVRARGLTLAVRPGAALVAPAAGTVRYAGRFRDYRRVVVIDHGNGWSTTLLGLERLDVAVGTGVRAGDVVGTAPVAEPRITVELRRRGRPVDVTALLG